VRHLVCGAIFPQRSSYFTAVMALAEGNVAGLRFTLALVAKVVDEWSDKVTQLRVLALTRYGALGASSRLRFMQYFQSLKEGNIQIEWCPLFDDAALVSKYQHGQYKLTTTVASYVNRISVMLKRHAFDLLWVEKEALPWCPLWLEAALLRGVPYVLDYDDAVFHNYDLHRIGIVRTLLGKRLDHLMANATLVVCGNAYLAQRALNAGATWVERLPTVIDLYRYSHPTEHQRFATDDLPRIVWIGSPSTVKYLGLLNQSLQSLAMRRPFVLRVIGANFMLEGVRVECAPWSEATEVSAISECCMGIMPLLDSAWERGKCGYKLIQYMACSLPVVASDVGVNAEIIQDGVNGFLAQSSEKWTDYMLRLLNDPSLRHQMGQLGRQRVENHYCIQKTGPEMVEWLRQSVVST
jgi:glycosyltransferase involved in cell wall biosynthesis